MPRDRFSSSGIAMMAGNVSFNTVRFMMAVPLHDGAVKIRLGTQEVNGSAANVRIRLLQASETYRLLPASTKTLTSPFN
ncbi:MAG: hypothetical protein ABIN89_19210 [Chitinophagaceae bacterium]